MRFLFNFPHISNSNQNYSPDKFELKYCRIFISIHSQFVRRSVNQKMSSGKNHRQCRPLFSKNATEEEGSAIDPFHSSDNEQDSDWQLPKRIKVEREPKKVSKRPAKNKLSPKERIARLNRKIQATQQSSNCSSTPVSSNQTKTTIVVSSSNDSGVLIGTGKNDDNRLGISVPNKPEPSPPDSFLDNFDHLFDSKEISHSTVVKEEPPNEVPSNSDATTNTILNLVLGLRDGMGALMSNFNSLRKQVTRLEIKTSGSSATDHSVNQLCIQPDILMDFDGTLAKEGFPIPTCVQLNDFEKKLRQDVEYREKMVRFLIEFRIGHFILLVCLLACFYR